MTLQAAPAETDFAASSLAMMLIFTGLGYALPFALYPLSHSFNGPMGSEILNMYFLVGWMGLAHFIYAYYGQAKALSKMKQNIAPFLGLVIFGALVLVGMRQLLGYMMFSFVMWVYFLPHFVKAEVHFTNVLHKQQTQASNGVYLFPAIAFTFFTVAIFGPDSFVSNRWYLIAAALATVGIGLTMGLQRQLKDPALSKYGLLAMFLIGEGLVWGTYRQYMVPQFQQGVYVFHIAMASFYHYFRSYDFAARMGVSKEQPVNKMFLPGIVLVNIAVIAVGYALTSYFASGPTRFVFDVSFFTFWVGLHQYASDVFNWLKRRPAKQGSAAAAS